MTGTRCGARLALVSLLLSVPLPAAGEPGERSVAADLNPLDRTAVDNWSPDASRASDWLVAACAAAPVGLMLDRRGRDRAGEIGLMAVETAVLTTGLTTVLKHLVERPRPYTYNDDPRIPASRRTSPAARRSFPSGHTANAFAAMVFFAVVHARLHPDDGSAGWIRGGCLTAAATTGYLRYRAGRHFPTDILAGAALGAVVGWAVPRLHGFDSPAAPGATAGGQVVLGLRGGF